MLSPRKLKHNCQFLLALFTGYGRRRRSVLGNFRRPAPAAGTVERSRVTPTALVTDTAREEVDLEGALRRDAATGSRRESRADAASVCDPEFLQF